MTNKCEKMHNFSHNDKNETQKSGYYYRSVLEKRKSDSIKCL